MDKPILLKNQRPQNHVRKITGQKIGPKSSVSCSWIRTEDPQLRERTLYAHDERPENNNY